MRYNPGTPQPPRAGGGERTIPHADAIAVRDDNVLLPIDVQGLSRERYRAVALDLVGREGLERRYPWMDEPLEARACRAGG